MGTFVYMFPLFLACLPVVSVATKQSPMVQVYSKRPGELGKPNVLICHVTNFYPPTIEVDLLKNEKEIPNANQTAVAFDGSWKYHTTKHVAFTPEGWDTYSCRVIHEGRIKVFHWEPDM